jgi:hypothetical protein
MKTVQTTTRPIHLPEDEDAASTLEAALNDPEGRALVQAIHDRKAQR